MITLEFIRGFMNRACQVDAGSGELVTTSGDGPLLRSIADVLRAEGIACTVGPVEDRFKLRIREPESLRVWQEKVGFLDAARTERLRIIIGDSSVRTE